MLVSLEALAGKDVINVIDGSCLGVVHDLEFDDKSACVHSLVIPGRPKLWGLLGREEDIRIRWDEVEIIGEDIILTRTESAGHSARKKSSFLQKIWD